MAVCFCGRPVSWPRRRYCSYPCQALASRLAVYGLDGTSLQLMLSRQGGACALCGMVLVFAQEYRAPSIDHDHVTGLARGVLCQSCNLRVGWFEQAVRHGSGVVVAQQRDGFAAKIAAYLQAHAKEHREGR